MQTKRSTSEVRGGGLHLETGLNPPVKYFTDHFKAVLFCGSFVLFLSCVYFAFKRFCLLMPCGHLLGMADLFALVCDV